VIVDTFTKPQGLKGKAKAVVMVVLKMIQKAWEIIINPNTWTKKRSWVWALVFLRCAYLFMNEYGLNPLKKSIKGDHVFLTGAGSGIGQGMAIKLGQMGCKLSLSDINVESLKETVDLCVKAGVKAENIYTFYCDVSSSQSIKEGASKARDAFGNVNILINNAGIVSGKPTMELTDAMMDRTLRVNTISHLHTIKEFLPGMIASKRGHIVTIASMAGLICIPSLSDYCASKFGAVAIDEAVRLELNKDGHSSYVKTTCICPYFISTGMFNGAKKAFPMYILTPQEVVDRIVAAIQQEEL
jgi:all-trans-retinol dehydrogenase (NAD+)